jgi:NAD+ kinase
VPRVSVSRIAILVHPTRDVRRAIDHLREWARAHGAEVVQLAGSSDAPQVAPAGTVDGADVIVAVGGDGTVLWALRAGGPAGLPVLGVACGSLGALTTVPAGDVPRALDCFDAGEWAPQAVPALVVRSDHHEPASAMNDLVVVRAGGSQVSTAVEVDGSLYGRFSGDGVIVSTQLGSSAYALAAGGPVLAPASGSWLITPLAPHGGRIPPLVVGADARVRLTVEPGHAGARIEVDGQPTGLPAGTFDVALLGDFATLVRVGEEEDWFTALRRRKIIIDSPRVLARDARAAARAQERPGPHPSI